MGDVSWTIEGLTTEDVVTAERLERASAVEAAEIVAAVVDGTSVDEATADIVDGTTYP